MHSCNSWCPWHHLTLASHDQKVMCHFLLSVLDLRNEVVPLTSHNASASETFNFISIIFTYAITIHTMPTLVPMVSHDQKGHTEPHFSCLDLRNAMMLLTILLALHDADASIHGVTWSKSQCCMSFQLGWAKEKKEWNGSINHTISITWC